MPAFCSRPGAVRIHLGFAWRQTRCRRAAVVVDGGNGSAHSLHNPASCQFTFPHNGLAVVDNAHGADFPCSPIVAMSCMLIALGGLPGTGKTSLARGLARVIDAVHLRIDTIEQAIRDATAADAVGTAGYAIAYAVAEDNLRLGRTVVADCVNPLGITRAGCAAVAKRSAVALVEVEVVCSDRLEHCRRVDLAASTCAGSLCRPGTRSWRATTSRGLARAP